MYSDLSFIEEHILLQFIRKKGDDDDMTSNSIQKYFYLKDVIEIIKSAV